MEPHEEPVTTEIAEETSAAPLKKRNRSWLAAGLGAVLLMLALAVLRYRTQTWRMHGS